jgi:NAD(P)-dependent dehydrogenase (short-subunit alcohol dehydrogenase family)
MKVIAITGGGAGIRRAIAWHFAQRHYGLHHQGRTAGRESLEVMREAGVKALFVPGFMSGQKLILDSGMTLKMICV